MLRVSRLPSALHSGSAVFRQARFLHRGNNVTGKSEELSRGLRSVAPNNRAAYSHRSELRDAKRIVVKLGSAVLTRENTRGLALGRVASIVEQVAQLSNDGKEMLVITSGAVAFGKQTLTEVSRLSMPLKEALNYNNGPHVGITKNSSRTSAAVGQCGLIALYDAMFSRLGIRIAQVLVTNDDFHNPESRHWLRHTLLELLSMNIVPIINTNDAVSPPASHLEESIENPLITDNDSLAAHLAAEAEANLMIIMSDVDGVYNLPPGRDGCKLVRTFSPNLRREIVFGDKSSVGLGGMESKISAATWALNRGVSTVICNGSQPEAISRIMSGEEVGTFFTGCETKATSPDRLATDAKVGSRILGSLSGNQRGAILRRLADLLMESKDELLVANTKDLREAESSGLEKSLLSRLSLSRGKLTNLADGIRSIAERCENDDILGKVNKRALIADGIELQQITVPIGVLLVIFESRPDCLCQVASLAIATGNGLLLKGGKEAFHSNRALYNLVQQALACFDAQRAISLLSSREDVNEILDMGQHIDLIIPRGSSELVRSIQKKAKGIPVLGHSEGVCHVFVDKDANLGSAYEIVRDAKCDYPAACNAMETLLIHRDLMETAFFPTMCSILKKEGVILNAGPRLSQLLTFGPPPTHSLKIEYSRPECAIEVVDDLRQAIDHINDHGSGHTDVIVTENVDTAENFLRAVDSACVFHNASTRFADGYRFGLGAEVGISTTRIHARGPVGLEGLLTTKWQIRGSGDIVAEFNDGRRKYRHESLPIERSNGGTRENVSSLVSQENS